MIFHWHNLKGVHQWENPWKKILVIPFGWFVVAIYVRVRAIREALIFNFETYKIINLASFCIKVIYFIFDCLCYNIDSSSTAIKFDCRF